MVRVLVEERLDLIVEPLDGPDEGTELCDDGEHHFGGGGDNRSVVGQSVSGANLFYALFDQLVVSGTASEIEVSYNFV